MLYAQVIDTGSGIAREDLSKLFNRFGKLSRTENVNQEGIGLGLTIVKNIVELSEGKVQVHSKGVGKGAYFCFSMRMKTVDIRSDQVREPLQSNRSFTL